MLRQRKTIVLHAGDLVFGRGRSTMKTLLGSCIAVTLWHPRLRLGGMCHFAFPRAPFPQSSRCERLEARYGNHCLRLFEQLARARGTQFRDYEARIFGGGNLSLGTSAPKGEFAEVEHSPVGDSNASQAFSGLIAEGVKILEADVGERAYRKLWFDPETGRTRCDFFTVGM